LKLIPKRILRLKEIKQDSNFELYHNEYKINYESWLKLSNNDRIIILQSIIQTDNNILNDFSKLQYNILPDDLKRELNKIKIVC